MILEIADIRIHPGQNAAFEAAIAHAAHTLIAQAKGAQGYTFDSANRLNQVNGVQSYIYDGQGRRVRTTDANSRSSAGG